MKVGIFSEDYSHINGFYSKVDGLIAAAKRKGLDYYRIPGYKEYTEGEADVTINWEPVRALCKGKKLTICWEWDTYRIGTASELAPYGPNVLFRAHATHYIANNFDPRTIATYWMPPAVDTEVFKPYPFIEKKYDIVFIGTYRPFPEFNILEKNFKFLNSQGRLNYHDYIETFNQGRLILNAPVARETNKRVMEAMAVGPALMSWGPDYTLLATPGKHFACYEPMWPGESDYHFEKRLIETVNYYLYRPKLLAKIQRAGRRLVQDQFTFDKQVERIETIIRKHIGTG